MWQHRAAHEDGYLLHDLDTGVAGLPGLLGAADSLEEGEEGGDSQGRGHHGKGASRGVSHILVHVVNVGTHGGDHGGKAGSFGEIGDDFTPFHTSIVVLVNQQGLNHHQNLGQGGGGGERFIKYQI